MMKSCVAMAQSTHMGWLATHRALPYLLILFLLRAQHSDAAPGEVIGTPPRNHCHADADTCSHRMCVVRAEQIFPL